MQKAGDVGLGLLLYQDQPVHSSKQVLVCRTLHLEAGETDRFQPFQKSQFRAGIADPVDHQELDQCRNLEGGVTIQTCAVQSVGKAKLVPDVGSGEDMTKIRCTNRFGYNNRALVNPG